MARFYELKFVMDKLEDGSRNWLVTAPAFPEVAILAQDMRQACVQGLHAIKEAIAGRFADGMDVPAPMKTRPGYSVEVPATTVLKVALYMICSRRGVSRAELSRRLEWHREQVDRLFRLDHESRLDQMEAAFVAAGIPLAIDGCAFGDLRSHPDPHTGWRRFSRGKSPTPHRYPAEPSTAGQV
jgi:antitoxin HicB